MHVYVCACALLLSAWISSPHSSVHFFIRNLLLPSDSQTLVIYHCPVSLTSMSRSRIHCHAHHHRFYYVHLGSCADTLASPDLSKLFYSSCCPCNSSLDPLTFIIFFR